MVPLLSKDVLRYAQMECGVPSVMMAGMHLMCTLSASS